MKKAVENRVKRLEQKIDTSDGIARHLKAIDGTTRGFPGHYKPITPEKKAEIERAKAFIIEAEMEILLKICRHPQS